MKLQFFQQDSLILMLSLVLFCVYLGYVVERRGGQITPEKL